MTDQDEESVQSEASVEEEADEGNSSRQLEEDAKSVDDENALDSDEELVVPAVVVQVTKHPPSRGKELRKKIVKGYSFDSEEDEEKEGDPAKPEASGKPLDNDADHEDGASQHSQKMNKPIMNKTKSITNKESRPLVMEAVVLDDGDDQDGDDVVAVAVETPTPSKSKKKAKQGRKSQANRQQAANDARAILSHKVPRLPLAVSDSHVVRSFGRIKIEPYVESTSSSGLYSTANTINPVGYSCDRYEFSPVHGRVLKMRCTIFDGAVHRTKKKGTAGPPRLKEEEDEAADENATVQLHDGPIFRIMWGPGVDEDDDEAGDTFDPLEKSMPLYTGKAPKEENDKIPEVGSRVKVRFDHDQWYKGTIIRAAEGKSPNLTDVTIQYDDGTTEDATCPDEEIVLSGSKADEKVIDIHKLNGRHVTTVIGTSAIEAWGKALLNLGLIDEYMMESAMMALKSSRHKGQVEAKGKLKAKSQQRQYARGRHRASSVDKKEEEMSTTPLKIQKASSRPSKEIETTANMEENADSASSADEETPAEGADPEEDPSEEELLLLERLEQVKEKFRKVQHEAQYSAIALADARIAARGPFFCNPFREIISEEDTKQSQQASWLATVIRKEKAKMGSTGNKRKIVTATDLLERNDNFFNFDIERLIEGLPGSEECPTYVFHSLRSGGAAAASHAWVHEAHLKQEQERERLIKVAKETQAKQSLQRDRELKRKAREEEKESRKRQKVEETEQKRLARVDDRMGKLNVQVDERLFKEACFQREKVIVVLAKFLNKEFTRRRRAAELVSANAAANSFSRCTEKPEPYEDEGVGKGLLPPFSRKYDEDVVRIWDFVSSFGKTFIEMKYISSIPTLQSLQEAIGLIREGPKGSPEARNNAIQSLIRLSVALCKPLSVGLSKLLSSVAAITPGSTVDAATVSQVSGEDGSQLVLPVDDITWQEVARLALLSDALNELGFGKQDVAHLLRGYRSGGHPNSKEAKRLRRSEDFSLAKLRQAMSEADGSQDRKRDNEQPTVRVRVRTPCHPSAVTSDWTFHLHNINSLPPTAVNSIKKNIENALHKLEKMSPSEKAESMEDLQKAHTILERLSTDKITSATESNTCSKARAIALQVLDRVTGETFPSESIGTSVNHSGVSTRGTVESLEAERLQKGTRMRMGLLKSLQLSEEDYNDAVKEREEYMVNALKLKEELEMKAKKMEGEEDDDEDEEDDDDTASQKDVGENEKSDDGESQKDGESDNVKPETNGKGEMEEGQREAKVSETGTEDKTSRNDTSSDDFAADESEAPELIRRCLAVLRTVYQSASSEPFVYPIDPQTNAKYYETVVKPMCLRDVGKLLKQEARFVSELGYPQTKSPDIDHHLEFVVAQFARNVRLIARNCLSSTNTGAAVISSAEEMLRLFERLLLDWVLAPESYLPSLEFLDDDRCVEYHPSDEDSLVLLCDGCEGKFNMSRLKPPLLEVPQGDWYCPRCLSGRSWETLDPRIGQKLKKNCKFSNESGQLVDIVYIGHVRRCVFHFSEDKDSKPSLLYAIQYENGDEETWSQKDVDEALEREGVSVPPIRCIEAIAESPGYGSGTDRGIQLDLIPVPLNPSISDAAAQSALASSAFHETIVTSAALGLCSPEELSANEWLRLLLLLVTKCASSDVISDAAGNLENMAAEKLAEEAGGTASISNVSQLFSIEDDDNDHDKKKSSEAEKMALEKPALDEPAENSLLGKRKKIEDATNAVAAISEKSGENESVSNLSGYLNIGASADASNGDVNMEIVPDADNFKKMNAAVRTRAARQKAREDSLASYVIKHQLKSVVSSFEEDTISPVVESSLLSSESGISLSLCRCRDIVCDFCGLSDVALGLPLLRVPNQKEWSNHIPYALRNRKTYLVADLSREVSSITVGHETGRHTKKGRKCLQLVRLRVNGEVVPEESDCSTQSCEEGKDGGMIEFLPRNVQGFQSELEHYVDEGLPFVTGSLSCHECCAIASHNARKEQIVKKRQEEILSRKERDAAMLCGRTMTLGIDKWGRTYWKFISDPNSLFICVPKETRSGDEVYTREWIQYSEPETIASVMVSLGKLEPVEELKLVYPASADMVRKGEWSQLLQKRALSSASCSSNVASNVASNAARVAIEKPFPENSSEIHGKDSRAKGNQPWNRNKEVELFQEGSDILVKSKSSMALWDASIVAVSKSQDSGLVNGFRVHYKDWSSRFEEWIEPARAFEPSNRNLHLQEEWFERSILSLDELPASVSKMSANKYLNAPNRAFVASASTKRLLDSLIGPSKSTTDRLIWELKAALLIIAAALPEGAVDTSDLGLWVPENVAKWSSMVRKADGPSSLMGCAILLEDSIHPEFVSPRVAIMLNCLPKHWKAVADASVWSVAQRVWLLDEGINYGQ